ncbi:hypothetical protein [Haliangium ochraceum]|uniref:PEGA domain-containing protein n=1 Tax=Haliangium ochraceum (strain DSM 14365 / JCM 11303 / SMP-2) TaxID=502025 RepID=D0LLJ3_HALO1|nr:hypothetical protein [Haliangium ochraceum]ACY13210.1 conserved hypothetical protein [Haliangium ochraceum DSM 14365]
MSENRTRCSTTIILRTSARVRLRITTLAALATFVMVAMPAAAQDEPPQDDDIATYEDVDAAALPWVRGVPRAVRLEAHRLFLEGNEDLGEGLFRRAGEKFRAALALWDHPAFHYNLGVAQMNLDQIIDAYRSFQRARRFGSRPIGRDKFDQAANHIRVLGNQLAAIEIACDQAGATVALDGTPIFIAPGAERVLVRPGRHRVEANKPGLDDDVHDLVLDPGDAQGVRLVLLAPERMVPVRRWNAWLPWGVVGAGALVMAGGAALDRSSSAAFDDFDGAVGEQCIGNRGCVVDGGDGDGLDDGLGDRHTSGRRLQWAARGVYAVGGLTVAAGAVLLYLNRERLEPRRVPLPDASVTFTPILGPSHVGLATRVAF